MKVGIEKRMAEQVKIMELQGYSMSSKAARAIALAGMVNMIGGFAARRHAMKNGIIREYRIARQLAAVSTI